MYISVNDAATKFNISKRRVQILCKQGRISGANMVSGVWLIPENAPKPVDGRRKHIDVNQMRFFDISQKALTIEDICKTLSISKATAKNWIRLGKIVPDIGDQLFSPEYIERFVAELKSGDNTKLKSRRNKKSATGKVLYKDYVHTASNQKLVAELLELGVIEDEKDLLVVLANFAVQLYYQSRGILYSDNNVLQNFLSQTQTDDFHILIRDLIGNYAVDSSIINKLRSALTKEILFVGQSVKLKMIGTAKKAVWSTSNKKVATVKAGKVTEKQAGTAKITAKLGKRNTHVKLMYWMMQR